MEQEQRRALRCRIYRPVRVQPSRQPVILETLTKNVGLGGLCCISSRVIPTATELRVELMLSDGEELLSLKGKVVWFQAIPHSEQFDLGIAFLDVPACDQRRLSTYCSRLGQSTVNVL